MGNQLSQVAAWKFRRLQRRQVVEEEEEFCQICHDNFHPGDEVFPPPQSTHLSLSLSPGDYPAVPPFPCHAQWVPCPLAGQVQTSHFDLLRCKTSPPNELPVQVDHLPVVPSCHHLGRIVRWRTSSCQLICIAKFCDVLHNKLNWKSGRGCTIGKI